MGATKYTKKLVKTILELRASGKHSITAICKHVKIGRDTLYAWQKDHPEFKEAWDAVNQQYLDHLGELALSGLALLISEHEVTEEKEEFGLDALGKPVKLGHTTTKKKLMPNTAAVIFTLTNRMPETWKQKQSIDHSIRIEQPLFGDDEEAAG